MKCETCREALSARLDGEAEPVPPDAVDRHLAGCPACKSWQRRAEDLRRTMTVRPAPAVPDLTAPILARAPTIRRRWVARAALGVIALVQLTLGMAQLLGVATGMPAHGDGGMMVGHLSHESTAWNLAVGVGFAWAALRTRAAEGQLPLVAGFVLVLATVSAADLLGAGVTVSRLLSHIPVVLGLLLLCVVYRQDRHDRRPTASARPEPAPEPGSPRPEEGTLAAVEQPRDGMQARHAVDRHHAA